MAFEFSAGMSTTPKKFKGKELDPVVFKSEHDEHPLVFVVEEVHRGWLNYLKRSMFKRYPNTGFKIIQVFPYKVTEDQIKQGGATKFYFKNCPDMRELIEPGQRIIPIGRALLSVTLDPDVTVNGFYDSIFQKTYFYAPELKCNVFPVDPTYKWYKKSEQRALDNFYRKFMWTQVETSINENPRPTRTKKVNLHLVEDVESFFEEHQHETEAAWDLETSSLDFLTGNVICITMSFNGVDGYYLRFKDVKDLERLDKFMKGKFQIGANLKFDVKFLKYLYPFENLAVDFDTMHAGHTLNEMRSNSLKTHAWMYTSHGGYDLELERYKLKYPRITSYAEIPEPVLRPYATMDAIVTYQIYKKMKAILAQDPELETYFYEIRMPLVRVFPDIELTGVAMDWDMVESVGKEFQEMINRLEEEMVPIFGRIDYGGHELPMKLEELKWPCLGKTKDGFYKTNKDCMTEWEELGMVGVDLLQQRKKLVSARDMFIGNKEDASGFWKFKGPDGRLHPNFFVMLALSHRLRCKQPNLQQFPKHSKEAKMIRKCFVGLTPEYGISETDYDGLQLRIGAILSGDEAMRDIFLNQGGDMHSITGHSIFFKFPQKFYHQEGKEDLLLDLVDEKEKIDPEKVFTRLLTLKEFLKWKKSSPSCKEARNKAKGFNFGLLFGATVYGVCYNVIMKDWKPAECLSFIRDMGLELEPRLLGEILEREKWLEDNKRIEGLSTGDLWNRKKDAYNKFLKENFEDLALVVAEYTRTEFFNTYKGLIPWIEACHKEAHTNGYIRSAHGARRLLPQLLYIGRDTDKKEVSGWENIAVNSRVQNFEVAAIARAMAGIHKDLKKGNYLSRLFGQIHDAIQLYIHKKEFVQVYDIIKDNMEKDYPEYHGIPLTAEADIAWPNNPDSDKRTFWGSSPVWEGESFEELYCS